MVYINLVYNFSFGKSKSGVKLKMQNKDKDSGILNRYWFTLQKISNIVHKDFIRCRFLYGLYRYINLNLYKNTRLYIIGCKTGCLFCNLLIFSVYCGETGIRTPGSVTFNGFQDRRNRPLCHLSKTPLSEVLSVESSAKVRIIFKSANILIFFSRINRIFVPSYKE